MSRKNTPAKDGDWISPRNTDFKLVCCDCGLVHSLNFVVHDSNGVEIPNATIIFQAFRNPTLTNRERARRRKAQKK